MMSLSEKLRQLRQEPSEQLQQAPADFGPQEEEAIVSLLLEKPDLFNNQIPHLQPALFRAATANAVMAAIHTLWLDKGVIAPRYIIRDALAQALKVGDFGWEDILKLVDRRPDVREIPFILDNLTGFIRKRILAKLHSDEALSLMEDPILHANYVNGVLSEL
ncbi:MAG: hypothetical protein H0T51_21030, partial [Pirellulales bacterium]|nr:hypothetical protein [Pirellulales bacterium]